MHSSDRKIKRLEARFAAAIRSLSMPMWLRCGFLAVAVSALALTLIHQAQGMSLTLGADLHRLVLAFGLPIWVSLPLALMAAVAVACLAAYKGYKAIVLAARIGRRYRVLP